MLMQPSKLRKKNRKRVIGSPPMDLLWMLIYVVIATHIVALMLWLNWTRIESSHSRERLASLVHRYTTAKDQ
jgi:hypothetical protein